MNVRFAVFTAYHVLKKYATKEPHKMLKIPYTDSMGEYRVERTTMTVACEALENLINYVYPGAETKQYQMVVLCENCKYYKTMHKRSNPRMKKRVCGLDGVVRRPEHYCASAIERS